MNPDVHEWVGKTVIIVVDEDDDVPIWHQGVLANGPTVGLGTRYGFSTMVIDGKEQWQPISDSARILAILPYPLVGRRVKVVRGATHVGAIATVTAIHPPGFTATLDFDKRGVPKADVRVEYLEMGPANEVRVSYVQGGLAKSHLIPAENLFEIHYACPNQDCGSVNIVLVPDSVGTGGQREAPTSRVICGDCGLALDAYPMNTALPQYRSP
jgi:hypothetical protein